MLHDKQFFGPDMQVLLVVFKRVPCEQAALHVPLETKVPAGQAIHVPLETTVPSGHTSHA